MKGKVRGAGEEEPRCHGCNEHTGIVVGGTRRVSKEAICLEGTAFGSIQVGS